MTDIAYHYNRSKHQKRIKSRHKKSQKLKSCTKYENLHQNNEIKHKPNFHIKNKKSTREIQRKQWSKYNKKCKPRASNYESQQLLLDLSWNGYDSNDTASRNGDDSVTSSNEDEEEFVPEIYGGEHGYPEVYKNNSGNTLLQYGSLHITQAHRKIDYYNSTILKQKVERIINKTFGSYECNYIPFDMNTFYGECCYWYYIFEKLGIVTELFHTKYLEKCDREFESKLSYYNGVVQGIIENILNTKHIFYILDEIDFMVEQQFEEDYYYSNHVVMNKKILIDIIDTYNCEDIGQDLSVMIAGYVMTEEEDDILCRYQQDDKLTEDVAPGELKTYKFKIGQHVVYDKKIEKDDWRDSDDRIIGKIYDGKDITDFYKVYQKIWSDSSPYFHYGKYRYTYDNIMTITWCKFKQYYRSRVDNGFDVKYSVIYMILLYYIDNAEVVRNTSCRYQKNRQDERIWKKAIEATADDSGLQNIFIMINRLLNVCKYKQNDIVATFKKTLMEKLYDSTTDDDDVADFCGVIMRSCYFNSIFKVNDFFKNEDHHLQHKTWWMSIWKMIPTSVNNEKLSSVYDLTVYNCKEYKKFCKTHREYGYAKRSNGSTRWGYQSMNKFDIGEFIFGDVVRFIMNRKDLMALYDDEVGNRMVGMIKAHFKKLPSFEEVLNSIDDMIKILDDEKCKNSTQSIADIDTYGMDKYSKNYLSKKIYFNKKILKKKYRKYNGKSMDKRIENKMRKYKNKFLFCQ